MPHWTGDLPAPPATIHLMGICGTAMGAFAGMLKDAGYEVTGSDKGIYPPMSDYLASLGITPREGFVAENLDHAPDLVVVGNVIRAVYDEAVALRDRDLPYTSMPELLGRLYLQPAHSVVVSGTHGKTTTTSIMAHLLDAAGLEPGFLIGGIAGNFERTARAGAGAYFVIEGDEYDTAYFDKRPKFVHYAPNTAILTSIEFDHADIYDDLAAIEASFRTLIDSLPEDGTLVARWDDPVIRRVCVDAPCKVLRYGQHQPWDGRIESVDTATGDMTFSVLHEGEVVGTFQSCMVGVHNLYNQVAAVAAAMSLGLSAETLAEGFASFAGIRRRQEILGSPGDVTVIDDFAHHPTAVHLTLQALRQRFGGRRLWAVWEPRSATSRRNVFQEAYADAFSEADRVIIAQPYDTSGIPPEERFSSDRLVQDLCSRGVAASTFDTPADIGAVLAAQAQPHDVIAILSNGAFGGLHTSLVKALQARFMS